MAPFPLPELGISEMENEYYLSINKNYLIPIKDNILQFLEKADKIYIATGDRENFMAVIKGSMQIDKITVGKIIAYCELKAGIQ